jgi:hypothetical protein
MTTTSREQAQAAAARGRRQREQQGKPNGEAAPLDPTTLCLAPAEWEARDIPPEDTLLGPFSTTTRTELSADTGLGKTMLGLARAHAIALGRDFLHWQSPRCGRCLYLDGEMPPGLIQTRLKVARAWFGLTEPLGRDRLCLLSKTDVEEHMPPLDTPDGARWLLDFVDKMGRFDDITFDNRTCLAVGDQAGDDASTQAIKHLQRQLTNLQTGQLWLHHTGYDTTRGYGRKAREWELDTTMVGEQLDDRPGADVAIAIRFTKSRRRTPDNRPDYEPFELELRQGQWSWQSTNPDTIPVQKLGRNQKIVRDAALKLLAASDRKAPPNHVAGHATVISLESLQDETRKNLVCDARHFASRFAEAINGLTNAHQLCHYDGLVWSPR